MNKIILKHSTMPGRIPETLEIGELAINSEDGALFFCDCSGKIHRLDAKNASPIEVFTRWALFGLTVFWFAASVAVFIK